MTKKPPPRSSREVDRATPTAPSAYARQVQGILKRVKMLAASDLDAMDNGDITFAHHILASSAGHLQQHINALAAAVRA